MKLHIMLIVGVAFALSSCAENKQAAQAQAGADDMLGSIKMPLPESESAKSVAARQAVINHMHLHAKQLGRLMVALDSGDLEATQTPAYWLSRHEKMRGVPKEWEPHLKAMRAAAKDIQWSIDLETARAAAGRVSESCHACHGDAGIEVDITRTAFD